MTQLTNPSFGPQSVTLPNGVNVTYDGVKAVHIETPPPNMMDGPICGICGNNDGVLDLDDFKQGLNINGDHCAALMAPGPVGTAVSTRALRLDRISNISLHP